MKTAVRLCPQAIFIQGNHSRYHEYSKKFMAILADFSPFIEPVSLDEAYMDVTGFESLHGTIRQMAVSVKKRVSDELDLHASIGIAPCKIVAKVASDYFSDVLFPMIEDLTAANFLIVDIKEKNGFKGRNSNLQIT